MHGQPHIKFIEGEQLKITFFFPQISFSPSGMQYILFDILDKL